MEIMRFIEHGAPRVEDPIFVEGLPGIGNVGKLAAQQLVDALPARLWFDVFSTDFPPQVTVQPDGTVRLVRNQVWVVEGTRRAPPLVVLTGDCQPLSGAGQFALVEGVLARLRALGCRRIYTLGGYGVGAPVDTPDVLGAATDAKTVERLKALGVRFAEDEPTGGIIGASGLFLGLAKEQGMTGACLMGETSGYMVDPKAARSLLEVLEPLLERTLDLSDLDDKAQELDRLAQQLHEAEVAAREPGDLNYIG